MTLNIKPDKEHTTQVRAMDIHGKYPYKLYLEIRGNTNIGRFIVVISDKQLNKTEKVEDILIQVKEQESTSFFKRKAQAQNTKPGMIGDGIFKRYRVRETSILQVGEEPIFVFRPIK